MLRKKHRTCHSNILFDTKTTPYKTQKVLIFAAANGPVGIYGFIYVKYRSSPKLTLRPEMTWAQASHLHLHLLTWIAPAWFFEAMRLQAELRSIRSDWRNYVLLRLTLLHEKGIIGVCYCRRRKKYMHPHNCGGINSQIYYICFADLRPIRINFSKKLCVLSMAQQSYMSGYGELLSVNMQ